MSENLYSTGQKVLSSQGQENWDKIKWFGRLEDYFEPCTVDSGQLVTMYDGWTPDKDIVQVRGHDISVGDHPNPGA